MADEFEFQRRFDYRKRMIDAFYKDIDSVYQDIRTVPQDSASEERQKTYIVDALRNIERRMDTFIKDLYD